MNRIIATAATILLAANAQAKCVTNEAWIGKDKAMHAAIGAAIGGGVTVAAESETAGIVAGTVVAFAKEAWDVKRAGHTCSLQDALVTTAGAVIGAKLGGLVIVPQRGGAVVGFAKEF